MDGVRKTFDEWAQNGKAESMETEHGKNVLKFLKQYHLTNHLRSWMWDAETDGW